MKIRTKMKTRKAAAWVRVRVCDNASISYCVSVFVDQGRDYYSSCHLAFSAYSAVAGGIVVALMLELLLLSGRKHAIVLL